MEVVVLLNSDPVKKDCISATSDLAGEEYVDGGGRGGVDGDPCGATTASPAEQPVICGGSGGGVDGPTVTTAAAAAAAYEHRYEVVLEQLPNVLVRLLNAVTSTVFSRHHRHTALTLATTSHTQAAATAEVIQQLNTISSIHLNFTCQISNVITTGSTHKKIRE